jgi:hypothetical protein
MRAGTRRAHLPSLPARRAPARGISQEASGGGVPAPSAGGSQLKRKRAASENRVFCKAARHRHGPCPPSTIASTGRAAHSFKLVAAKVRRASSTGALARRASQGSSYRTPIAPKQPACSRPRGRPACRQTGPGGCTPPPSAVPFRRAAPTSRSRGWQGGEAGPPAARPRLPRLPSKGGRHPVGASARPRGMVGPQRERAARGKHERSMEGMNGHAVKEDGGRPRGRHRGPCA